MFIIFFLIIIIFILIFILKNIPNFNIPKQFNNYEDNNAENSIIDYKQYYQPKRYITTPLEMSFYTVLLEIAKELDYILFCQVSLYNIVHTKDYLDYSTKTKYFNKIASKSIDFVLVDKKCRIQLCIELDDSTHKQKKRVERDRFINKLFSDLEINLLRYPIYPVYYKDVLKKKIQESIKDHYYV